MKIFKYSLLISLNITLVARQTKIIGLVPVRNEPQLITPCLQALSMYTDGIVVLDDASDDNTVQVIESIAKQCKVGKIIRKTKWYRDEPGDRNLLLKTGRELGGTHFVVIDADEIFSANCLNKNFLRNRILKLKPGDKLCATWIQLWRSVNHYRYDHSVWSAERVDCIFADDQKCYYDSAFIHTPRTPSNLQGNVYKLELNETFTSTIFKKNSVKKTTKKIMEPDKRKAAKRYLFDQIVNQKKSVNKSVNEMKSLFMPKSPPIACYSNDFTIGLMHFQFVNWDNLLIKQAWYRCLEKIRNPDKSSEKINVVYGESKNEDGIRLRKAPKKWFVGYPFFNQNLYNTVESWQKKQVLEWFSTYGKEFFSDLDIWDISWN